MKNAALGLNDKTAMRHLAVCASNTLDLEKCGCVKATSATYQSGLILSRSGLFERKSPCCTTGKCKRCNSKNFQKVFFRLSVGFSKITSFFRSADK